MSQKSGRDRKIDLDAMSIKLLDYYKRKCLDWQSRYVGLLSDVEECRMEFCQTSEKEIELINMNEKVVQLGQQVAELKRSLAEEREHVVRLSRDKDNLRMELAESRRKMKLLLDFAGLRECDLFPMLTNPVKEIPSSFKLKSNVKKLQEIGPNPKLVADNEESTITALNLKVKMLECHLEEQRDTMQERIEGLVADLNSERENNESQRISLLNRNKCLTCQLDKIRLAKVKSIHDMTCQQIDKVEEELILINENKKLMKCLKICEELLGDDFPNDLDPAFPKTLRSRINKLESELDDRENRLEILSNQFKAIRVHASTVEADHIRMTELHLAERSKLLDKIKLLQSNIEKEKKRRVTEAEGFRSDIKLLRSKLQSIERCIRIEALKKRQIDKEDV